MVEWDWLNLIAIDTNLLVYAHRRGCVENRSAIRVLEHAFDSDNGWGIPFSCVTEFWSIVTNPKVGSRPSQPKEAHDFIFHILDDGGGEVWGVGRDFSIRLMQMAHDLSIKGTRIFDLQIALVSFENGATEIWTHDKSFTRIPGLRVVHPL